MCEIGSGELCESAATRRRLGRRPRPTAPAHDRQPVAVLRGGPGRHGDTNNKKLPARPSTSPGGYDRAGRSGAARNHPPRARRGVSVRLSPIADAGRPAPRRRPRRGVSWSGSVNLSYRRPAEIPTHEVTMQRCGSERGSTTPPCEYRRRDTGPEDPRGRLRQPRPAPRQHHLKRRSMALAARGRGGVKYTNTPTSPPLATSCHGRRRYSCPSAPHVAMHSGPEGQRHPPPAVRIQGNGPHRRVRAEKGSEVREGDHKDKPAPPRQEHPRPGPPGGLKVGPALAG